MHRLLRIAIALGAVFCTACTVHDFTAWAVCHSAYDEPKDKSKVYGREPANDDRADCQKIVAGTLEEPALKKPEPDMHAKR